MKFYDVKRRKPTTIPDKQVHYKIYYTPTGAVKMAIATAPAGNKLFKIVERTA
jgi:hypothetical protein